MPEQRQIIVQQPVPADKPLGASKVQNAKSAFSASPIYKGEMTDDERRKLFQELVLDGTVSGGNGVNLFNPNFVDAPNLEEVETGGGGLPSTPYTPNLTSPGPGSMNAADQPVYEGEFRGPDQKTQFGTGLGGTTSPSKTSDQIARQGTLSSYISGRSYAGSDGQN